MSDNRVRRLVDDTLNGDLKFDGHDIDIVNACRALARATRILADAFDEAESRADKANARLATLAFGIIGSVISAAILLALKSA